MSLNSIHETKFIKMNVFCGHSAKQSVAKLLNKFELNLFKERQILYCPEDTYA